MAEGVHYVVSSDVNVSMFNGASPFEDFEEEIGALLRARPGLARVSYRVFNCILVHFIPLPVFIFYSFTGIYILLILFLYSILSTLFPCTLYGLIFPFLFLYFYSIFVYSFSLFSVPAWMGLYRRGWDYTAWSVFV